LFKILIEHSIKIGVFFAILGCGTHFKSELRRWLEIDQDNLRMKFSALNVDFSSPSSNLLVF